jgi:hypothetical protein
MHVLSSRWNGGRVRVAAQAILAWGVWLGVEGCGGAAATDAGADAGAIVGDSGPARCPGDGGVASGRPSAAACPVRSNGTSAGSTCQVPNDCEDGGLAQGQTVLSCLQAACPAIQCLTDDDCATGEVCACASQIRGSTTGVGALVTADNRCVASNCRVDADCGSGGVCSADYSARCGTLSAYFCHSAADTCQTDADCCGDTPLCGYQPALGHWACQAWGVCNG